MSTVLYGRRFVNGTFCCWHHVSDKCITAFLVQLINQLSQVNQSINQSINQIYMHLASKIVKETEALAQNDCTEQIDLYIVLKSGHFVN